MKWLKRRLYGFIGFIAKLPFKLVYLFFRWLFVSKKRLNRDGYVLKNSASGRPQLEHRAIAEHILGRRLERWEVVHHINGQRSDNRPANLCVMSRNNHIRYHKWYDWKKENHGRYPSRETQLRKLTESFDGILLGSGRDERSSA